MNKMTMKRSAALAIAGAMAITLASPSWAAPVLSNAAGAKARAPNAVTNARHYRNGYRDGGRAYRNDGGAIIGGLALGVIGAVAAQGYYRDRGYDGPYAYGGDPYRSGYGYGPGYGYAPGYAYGPGYGYDDRQRSW